MLITVWLKLVHSLAVTNCNMLYVIFILSELHPLVCFVEM